MKEDNKEALSKEEIAKCVAVLEALNANASQLFDLPEEQRVALMRAAGQLSRPDKD